MFVFSCFVCSVFFVCFSSSFSFRVFYDVISRFLILQVFLPCTSVASCRKGSVCLNTFRVVSLASKFLRFPMSFCHENGCRT